MQPKGVAYSLGRPISQELLARDIARLAYVTEVHPPKILLIRSRAELERIIRCRGHGPLRYQYQRSTCSKTV